MKKILMLALAVSAAAVTAAPAAAATYNVKANVTATCTALTGSATDLDFGTLTVAADGTLTGTHTKSSTQASVVCNGAATTMTVVSTPMTNAATAFDAGFTNTINYTTAVTLAGFTYTGPSPQVTGARSGLLTVTASALAPAGGLALVAGNYAGTITVTLAPSA